MVPGGMRGGSVWCSVAWNYREGQAAAVPGVKKMLLGSRRRGRGRQRQRGEFLWAMTKKNCSGGEKEGGGCGTGGADEP